MGYTIYKKYSDFVKNGKAIAVFHFVACYEDGDNIIKEIDEIYERRFNNMNSKNFTSILIENFDIDANEEKAILKEYINKCINDIEFLKNGLKEIYWEDGIRECFKENGLPFSTVKGYQKFLKDKIINQFE